MTTRRKIGRIAICRQAYMRLSPQLPHPWQYLPAEHCQVGNGVFVADRAALAHHQEVAEAADMGVEGFDLVEHVVGGAGEDEAGVDRVFDGHRAGVEGPAVL